MFSAATPVDPHPNDQPDSTAAAVRRPLRSAPKLTLLVSAIGCSFILVNLALFWGGVPMKVFGGGVAAAAAVPGAAVVQAAADALGDVFGSAEQ